MKNSYFEMPLKIKWTYELLVAFFADLGHTLLSKEYTNCETKYDYQCKCGNPQCSITIGHLKEGKDSCKPCSTRKRKATNVKTYGFENPMQNTDVKEKYKETCLKNLGFAYPMQNAVVQGKSKATCLENLGVENPAQNEEVKEKIKLTNLKNLGVEHPAQNEEVKEKMKKTCLENLGVEYPFQNEEVKEKIKLTHLKNLSVEYPMQNEDVKEKTKKTCLEKFGVAHPMQNSEVFERQQKATFKRKRYRFASGEERNVQGYEPFALDLLLEQGITEEDLLLGFNTMPQIMYEHDHRTHRYYPDIYIPSQNKIVEVKSDYTYNAAREITHLKMQACQVAGLEAEIWIFSREYVLLHVINDFSSGDFVSNLSQSNNTANIETF